MNLVLIETASNQSYIFATNRRRENVGASEFVLRAGTMWVVDALRDELGIEIADADQLLDPEINIPIETGSQAELVYMSSGKALLVCRDEPVGRRLVSNVTARAAREAPGLSVTGVVGVSFDSLDEADMPWLVRDVHLEHERLRAFRSGPSARHLRIPVAAQCESSGLPAQHVVKDSGSLLSSESVAKSKVRDEAYLRMGWKVAPESDEDERPWSAIVHADGNRFGRFFLALEDYASGCASPRTYLRKLRRLSLAIDEATKAAFVNAVAGLGGAERSGVLPLVLGGDDVTVLCEDGSRAIELAAMFLTEFERTSAGPDLHEGILLEVARSAGFPGGLTACAGVALVKPHFPFHMAYTLAEDLTTEAKRGCREHGLESCSALSIHVLYDSSVTSLADIRARQTVGGSMTYGSPYIVTQTDDLPEEGRGWARSRTYDSLLAQVSVLTEVDNGKRVIPRSQIGEWRRAARLGRAAGDAAYHLSRHRYRADALAALEGDKGSFFWSEGPGDRRISATSLVDAVSIAQVQRGEAS